MSFNSDIEFTNNTANALGEHSLSLGETVQNVEFGDDDTDILSNSPLSLEESLKDVEFTSSATNNLIEQYLSFDGSISSIDIELGHDADIYTRDLEKHFVRDNIDDLPISRGIDDNRMVLSDTALLCVKTLVSPIALFSHVARFALSSISAAFSFAIAFFISDVMFFSILDKFSLSYIRYILLGVTGVVALSSIKEIFVSFVNLSLSFFKGVYSWYFSLINPDCSFRDFLLGRNTMTNKN